MSEPLRVGIAGLGRVAWMLEDDPLDIHPCTHAGAWRAQRGVAIVAGCDPDAARRRAFRERFPEVRVYRALDTMLRRHRLDAVSLCAYATERRAMALASLAAGVRGLWCEKAMACSLAEAADMEAAAARAGAVLMVSHLRRWDPRYRRTQALLEAGAIGRLQSVHAQFSGNLLHTGTHAFDVLRMLAGEPVAVRAWLDETRRRNRQSGYRFQSTAFEDLGGHGVIHFDSGVVATVQGLDKDYFRFEFELIGDAGIIRVGNTRFELWQRAPSTHYTGFTELARAPLRRPRGNLWVNAARELTAALRHGRPVSCDAGDGRAALAVGLAMHESHRRGGRAVGLDEVPSDVYVPSR